MRFMHRSDPKGGGEDPAHLFTIFDAAKKTEELADPVSPSDKSISVVPILDEKLFWEIRP